MRTSHRIVTTLAVISMAAGRAPTVQAQTISGCYVPTIGAFYLIKQTGLPATCLAAGHTEVTLVGPTSLGWSLLGNAGTSVATNFIGTTDGQPLQLRVNNAPIIHLRRATYAGRMTPVPAVGIGTTLPVTPLDVSMEDGSFRVHPFFGSQLGGTTLLGAWAGITGGAQVRYSGPTPGFIDVGQNGTGDYIIEDADNPRIIMQRSGNGGARLAALESLVRRAGITSRQ